MSDPIIPSSVIISPPEAKIQPQIPFSSDNLTEEEVVSLLSPYPDVLSVLRTNPQNLKHLTGKSREWFKKRLNIIPSYSGDVHYLSWRLFVLDQPLFITDDFFDFVMDDKWPHLVRDYALTFLSNPHEVTLDQLRIKMRFITDFISEIALESDIFSRSEALKDLLIYAFDFLLFYHEIALDDEWRVVMGNGDKRKYLRDMIFNASQPQNDDRNQDYAGFKARESLSIEFDSDFSSDKDKIMSFMKKSHFSDLAKPFVSSVLFTKKKRNNIFNNYSSEMQIFSSGHSTVKALFHELGHAFHKFLRHQKDFHKLLYQYVLELSVYNALYSFSESYSLADGKNSYQHIAEAFAEDFRWFWFLPEAVPKNRLRIIGKMMEAVYPDIRIDAIRQDIRSALIVVYALDVDFREMVVGVVCDVQKILEKPNLNS